MNNNNFKDLISKGITVVDFYADWCSPCKMLSPVFQQVEEALKNDAYFLKINIDNHMEIAQEYKISTIPTILIFKNSELADRMVGFNSAEIIKSRIEKVINSN